MNHEDNFTDILDKDETIRWFGTPNFTAYMCGGLPFLAIGLLWGLFDLFFILMTFFGKHGFPQVGAIETAFFAVFFTVHLCPFWGSILYMIWRSYVPRNTFYAFSDKRVIIRSGVFGVDYQIFEFDKIRDIQVKVGPIEKMCGVGSIMFNTGDSPSFFFPFIRKVQRFAGIENQYDVFRHIKELAAK
jgi:membrane protein YdbS with pleckstrin-like domain